MRRRIPVVVFLIAVLMTITLPSCNSSDAPTAPAPPPAPVAPTAPAVVSFNVVLTGASATGQLDPVGPARQQRRLEYELSVGAGDQGAGGTVVQIQETLFFGRGRTSTRTFTPSGVQAIVASGQTQTYPRTWDFSLQASCQEALMPNNDCDIERFQVDLTFLDGFDSSTRMFNDEEPLDLSKTDVMTPACQPDATTMCLNDGRFKVTADWTDTAGGATQSGNFLKLNPAGDGGEFWFFNASNFDVFLQVLDQCNNNDRWWVFASATTNVEYTLTVTDTQTSTTKSYFNPLGTPAAAITDTQAFATCPGPVPEP